MLAFRGAACSSASNAPIEHLARGYVVEELNEGSTTSTAALVALSVTMAAATPEQNSKAIIACRYSYTTCSRGGYERHYWFGMPMSKLAVVFHLFPLVTI